MPEHQRSYKSYLLRLWRDGDEPWRMSLEPSTATERQNFASLDDLIAFLTEQTALHVPPALAPAPPNVPASDITPEPHDPLD